MNTRKMITRNIEYSIVTVSTGQYTEQYIVYGKTTEAKELKKLLKDNIFDTIPSITVETKKEQRAITLQDFLAKSIVIK